MSRFITVRNLNYPDLPLARVKYCDSFMCRLRGLMFRKRLEPDDGLLLVQGNRDSRLDTSIHMLFVPFDLTVVWINTDMTVVDKIIAKAWRPAYAPTKPACFILEIHPDRWDDYQIGDKVEFQNV
ncbi:MAG: DUF192 domain-containing protein [Anaerolineales bacterium]|jgi:uncharacterized membrane protein (UPF0127 family)